MTSLLFVFLLASVSLCSALIDGHEAETGKGVRTLDKLSGGEYIRALHRLGGRRLDKISGGELLRAMPESQDRSSGEVLRSLGGPYALRRLTVPRGLDRISGGEYIRAMGPPGFPAGPAAAKRFDSLSGLTFGGDQHAARKRWYGHGDFDEIDNVGWPGFTKRNFDEIDRTGFEGFYKRAANAAAAPAARED
ncbi:uncharacterized protein LOC8036113 [Ixodes scapularis]|uniref:uncharacterized protein LOC8036113 n=1 Tax=Ixodes scapularis TaxID=6945 RepID=UPI001C38845C|nr:uncharacterized protein LOC8036113 [Ixodes scapularis]